MFVTMIAVLCRLASTGLASTDCVDEIITNSALDSALTFQSCLINGQAGLAKWKEEHPIYHSEAWRIQRYKCVPGDYKMIARHPA